MPKISKKSLFTFQRGASMLRRELLPASLPMEPPLNTGWKECKKHPESGQMHSGTPSQARKASFKLKRARYMKIWGKVWAWAPCAPGSYVHEVEK